MKGAPIKNAMAAVASLPRRAEEGPAGRDRRVRPRRQRSLGLHDEHGTISRTPSPKTPATAEGTHIYDALIEAVEQGEGPGTRANDGRTPLGRHRRRKRRVAVPRRCRPPPTTNVRVISVGLKLAAVQPGDAQEPREAHGRHVHRGGDARRARADLQGDRAAALERVRAHVPLAAPAPAEGRRRS